MYVSIGVQSDIYIYEYERAVVLFYVESMREQVKKETEKERGGRGLID